MPQAQIGTAIILKNSSGNILIGTRSSKDLGYKKLSFPGGHLEFGEEIQETMKRETFEECGIELPLEAISIIGFTQDIMEDRHYITFWGMAQTDTSPKVVDAGEMDSWKWISWEELLEQREILFQPIQNFLKAYPDFHPIHNYRAI